MLYPTMIENVNVTVVRPVKIVPEEIIVSSIPVGRSRLATTHPTAAASGHVQLKPEMEVVKGS